MNIFRILFLFFLILSISCSPEDIVISGESTNSNTPGSECDTFSLLLEPFYSFLKK